MSAVSVKINEYAKAAVAFLGFVVTLVTTLVGAVGFALPAEYVSVASSVVAAITVVSVAITTNTPKITSVIDDATENVGPQLSRAAHDVEDAVE